MKSTIVLFCTISLLTGFLGGWRSLIKEGNKSYKTGNFTKAKKIYQSAIDTKPDEPISNYNLGAALYQNKEFDQAEKESRDQNCEQIRPAQTTITCVCSK